MTHAQVMTTPFDSVLVANRGEIARRVFATARSMGMVCVAVFTDADADAAFVREADEAIRLATGYLDGDAIIGAAKLSGAQAVHPGYGFLSENANFARSVQAAGLIWVGPTPDIIATMGDKILAKEAALAAGLPVLDSYDTESLTGESTELIRFPVLVKAAAGGGGKGMRVVQSADQLDEAIASASREADKAFGDSRVFVERYVPRARHIEIQILGDAHGNLVHLGERECSIQRRHQKIIEESPSPVVSPELRQAMGNAALALASSLSYSSTGTVEFLLDEDSLTGDSITEGGAEFFFLEVNTRLQVEHPVTEAITGLDLVREQLQVAAGQQLNFDQSSIDFLGHAIEARLYAEDPANGFLPSAGTVDVFEPAETPALRWDVGIEQGSEVGVHFDPMLGKVIAHGPTRAEAAAQLARGLERLHLGGLTTNRDFLAATLRHPQFLAGATTTDFIERVNPTPLVSPDDVVFAAVAGALWMQGRRVADLEVLPRVPSGWRNSKLPMERTSLLLEDGLGDGLGDGRDQEPMEVRYRRNRDGSFSVRNSANDNTVSNAAISNAIIHAWSAEWIDIELDGLRRGVRVSHTARVSHTGSAASFLYVQTPSTTLRFRIEPRFVVPGADTDTSTLQDGGLVSPMPGSVLEVRVNPDDEVVAGQVLLVLEAMKMEHPVPAPRDGTVSQVLVEVGQQVELGLVLVEFE